MPAKAITYLTGANAKARTPFVHRPLVLAARTSLIARVARPRWKPLNMSGAKPQARTLFVPRPLVLAALAGLKLTLFWRAKSGRPLKGQLWPRTR